MVATLYFLCYITIEEKKSPYIEQYSGEVSISSSMDIFN